MGLGPIAGVGDVLSAAARHNFVSIPRIRSESPAFDLHHPDAGIAAASNTIPAPHKRPGRTRWIRMQEPPRNSTPG